jgi:hypothetical protein
VGSIYLPQDRTQWWVSRTGLTWRGRNGRKCPPPVFLLHNSFFCYWVEESTIKRTEVRVGVSGLWILRTGSNYFPLSMQSATFRTSLFWAIKQLVVAIPYQLTHCVDSQNPWFPTPPMLLVKLRLWLHQFYKSWEYFYAEQLLACKEHSAIWSSPLWCNSPHWANDSSLSRLHHHTETHHTQ